MVRRNQERKAMGLHADNFSVWFVAAPVWHHARPPHHAGEHSFLWTASKRSGIDTVLNMDFVVLKRYGYCPLSTTCFS